MSIKLKAMGVDDGPSPHTSTGTGDLPLLVLLRYQLLDDQLISFAFFTTQINFSFLPSHSLTKNVEILCCIPPILAHVWVLSYEPDVHVHGVREHAAISPRDVRDVLVVWNERPLRCIPGVRWGRAASWPRRLGLKAEREPLEEALQKAVKIL